MNIAGSSFVFRIIKSIPRLSFFELRCQVLFLLWLQYFGLTTTCFQVTFCCNCVCCFVLFSIFQSLTHLSSICTVPNINSDNQTLATVIINISYPHTLLSHSPVHTTLLQLYQIITVLVGAVCEYSSVCLNFSSCN